MTKIIIRLCDSEECPAMQKKSNIVLLRIFSMDMMIMLMVTPDVSKRFFEVQTNIGKSFIVFCMVS